MTTTYLLSLSGDEEKAAHAAHCAKSRRAKLLSISRRPAARTPAAGPRGDGIVVPPPTASPGRATTADHVTRDPEALAALLLRTLDVQNGLGVVRADFDSEEFAAAVMARIAALGRDVTCTGQVAAASFGAGLRARIARA